MHVAVPVEQEQAVVAGGQEDHVVLEAAELHPGGHGDPLRAVGQVAHAGAGQLAQVSVLTAAPQLQGVAHPAGHQAGPADQADVQRGVQDLGLVRGLLEVDDDAVRATWILMILILIIIIMIIIMGIDDAPYLSSV